MSGIIYNYNKHEQKTLAKSTSGHCVFNRNQWPSLINILIMKINDVS